MLDPASEDGKELVEYVKLFLDHMVPARLGLLLVVRDNSEVGVALCRGFSYLLAHESQRRAFSWLYEVVCGCWRNTRLAASLNTLFVIVGGGVGSKFIGTRQSHCGGSCQCIPDNI